MIGCLVVCSMTAIATATQISHNFRMEHAYTAFTATQPWVEVEELEE